MEISELERCERLIKKARLSAGKGATEIVSVIRILGHPVRDEMTFTRKIRDRLMYIGRHTMSKKSILDIAYEHVDGLMTKDGEVSNVSCNALVEFEFGKHLNIPEWKRKQEADKKMADKADRDAAAAAAASAMHKFGISPLDALKQHSWKMYSRERTRIQLEYDNAMRNLNMEITAARDAKNSDRVKEIYATSPEDPFPWTKDTKFTKRTTVKEALFADIQDALYYSNLARKRLGLPRVMVPIPDRKRAAQDAYDRLYHPANLRKLDLVPEAEAEPDPVREPEQTREPEPIREAEAEAELSYSVKHIDISNHFRTHDDNDDVICSNFDSIVLVQSKDGIRVDLPNVYENRGVTLDEAKHDYNDDDYDDDDDDDDDDCRKRPVSIVSKCGGVIAQYNSINDASEKCGIHRNTLRKKSRHYTLHGHDAYFAEKRNRRKNFPWAIRYSLKDDVTDDSLKNEFHEHLTRRKKKTRNLLREPCVI